MTDPRTERDRTLRRVRGTTAAAGVGAVVATGTLAGWLGHTATTGTASPSTTAGSSTSSPAAATPSDTLAAPTAAPTNDATGGDDQPSVTTGGS